MTPVLMRLISPLILVFVGVSSIVDAVRQQSNELPDKVR
jgi:hypothetical protein